MCVCVCVCAAARERERESVCARSGCPIKEGKKRKRLKKERKAAHRSFLFRFLTRKVSHLEAVYLVILRSRFVDGSIGRSMRREDERGWGRGGGICMH